MEVFSIDPIRSIEIYIDYNKSGRECLSNCVKAKYLVPKTNSAWKINIKLRNSHLPTILFIAQNSSLKPNFHLRNLLSVLIGVLEHFVILFCALRNIEFF